MRLTPIWFAAAFALTALLGRTAWAEPVAVTFDDLPSLSLRDATPYWSTTTTRLLAGLRRDRIPAIGFVNESKLEDDPGPRTRLLERWLAAGMDLGNHTYSHESLTSTPAAAYIADMARGEVVTRRLLAQRGQRPRWFRYPYLETGVTPADRSSVEAWLAAHGYRVAPVSMENTDWVFAYPYDDAVVRHDRRAARQIRRAYLAYTAAVVPWYRRAALQLLGRRPAFVLLLHASRLNADCIGALAAILHANHLQPVGLETAMRDPAYAIADHYVGPDGNGSLARWALTLGKTLPFDSLPQLPAHIRALDARLARAAS